MIDALQKIYGKSRLNVFKQLRKESPPVRMKIQGLDYDGLTTVTDVRRKDNTHFFIVRPPKKINASAADFVNRHLHFEFNSKDGMRYMFICTGSKILDKEIWIPFPEFIEQIQRRRDFRLGFQEGTTLNFEMDSVKYKMNLVNLSMGGACAENPGIKDGTKRVSVLKSGDTPLGVNIVSSSQKVDLSVQIKQASIIRVNELKNNNGYSVGLQFMDIEKEEVKKLKKMIYDLQRYFLQRRLKPDI